MIINLGTKRFVIIPKFTPMMFPPGAHIFPNPPVELCNVCVDPWVAPLVSSYATDTPRGNATQVALLYPARLILNAH